MVSCTIIGEEIVGFHSVKGQWQAHRKAVPRYVSLFKL